MWRWLLLFAVANLVSADLTRESEILLEVYNRTNGENWNNRTNWGSLQVCDWHGVTCNSSRVVGLDLRGNGLNGSLPPSFGELVHLTYFDFSQNQYLGGDFPQNFGNLTNLTTLNFGNCDFTGSLEFLSGLTSLVHLYGMYNQRLTGPFPANFGDCRLITNIGFAHCPLLSGPLPESICNLKILEQMDFSYTSLDGTIPSWECFPILARIDLSYTLISGSFPVISVLRPAMLSIRLHGMRLSGSLLGNFSNFPLLTLMDISYNEVTGLIPHSLCELHLLLVLALNNNWFTDLPDCSFHGWMQLNLDVSNNLLTSIPFQIWRNSSGLGMFNISGNHIPCSGLPVSTIPGFVSRLGVLSLSNNPLGCRWETFVDSLWTFSGLHSLYVSNCSMTRNNIKTFDIPAEWEDLDVSHNPNMGGDLFSIKPLSVLTTLIISFTGLGIDVQALGGAELRYLDISNRDVDCYRCANSKIADLRLNMLKMDNLPCATVCGVDIKIQDDPSVWDYFAPPIALFCPSRTTQSGGQVIADMNFLNFRGCACASSSFWWNGLRCVSCSTNVICDPNATNAKHQIAPGYYPVINGKLAKQIEYPVATLLMCGQVEICNASNSSGFQCPEGRELESLMCSRCSSGYFAVSLECGKCEDGYEYVVLIALPLCFILFALYLWFRSDDDDAQLAIGFFTAQVLGALEAFSPVDDANVVSSKVNFPREMLNFRPWAIECVTPSATFENKFWATLVFPLFIVLCCAFLFMAIREQRSRLRSVLVGALDLMYLPLCGSILSVYNCVHKGGYLSNAPYIQCEDAIVMQGIGAIGIVVYVLGIPLSITWTLYRCHDEFKTNPDFVHPLNFLMSPLNNDGENYDWADYMWAVPGLLLFRKLGIVALLNLLEFHNGVMPLMILVVILGCEFAVLIFKPYKSKLDTGVEFVLIFTCAVLYTVRILQSSNSDSFKFKDTLANARIVFEVLAYGGVFLVLATCAAKKIATFLRYCWKSCTRRAPSDYSRV